MEGLEGRRLKQTWLAKTWDLTGCLVRPIDERERIMPVHAITPDYHGDIKDARENYHGNIMVFLGWDHHLLFCASKAYPLPPEMTFRTLLDEVMPEAFGQHPEFDKIDWSSAQWLLDGEVFTPDPDRGLEEQGVSHKSLIRFATPELKGYAGVGI